MLAAAVFIGPATLLGRGATFLAVLLFIAGAIAALIVYLRFWVAVPATVVERGGVVESLSRSAQLTKGCRGKILGIVIILAIMYFAFMFCVGQLVGSSYQGFQSPAAPPDALATVVLFVADALAQSFGSVLACVCYYELRRSKEGVDAQEIATVFD